MKHSEKIQMFYDIFAPKSGEKVLFLIDTPHNDIEDNISWKDRRTMAQEWYTIFKEMETKTGFSVEWFEYQATGIHNSPLPVEVLERVRTSNLVIAMTEYSASSSLLPICKTQGTITRCASMPGIERRMEETALRANYQQIKQYAERIAKMLNDAVAAEIVFSTGDKLNIDLRHRIAHTDTGECTQIGQSINFPSGEACKVPYEAVNKEINEHGLSKTNGVLPVISSGELLKYIIKNNTIIDIIGQGRKAEEMRLFFMENATRRNIAEFGIGCNPNAVVTGNVLEDEKVGLHIAYGMSTHLGGKIQSDTHIDICYSKGCPIEGISVVLHNTNGSKTEIIQNATLQYDLFR